MNAPESHDAAGYDFLVAVEADDEVWLNKQKAAPVPQLAPDATRGAARPH
jgi:hypothetical protein